MTRTPIKAKLQRPLQPISVHQVIIPQQGDFRLLDPPSGQDACGAARTRDRRVLADLGADSLSTVFWGNLPSLPPLIISTSLERSSYPNIGVGWTQSRQLAHSVRVNFDLPGSDRGSAGEPLITLSRDNFSGSNFSARAKVTVRT
ncbi:hypothetical protein PoB_002548100 [Plakobranchus ocellatus]|uniref:Uncharacterized protein n=1 Tax=Plakobranchus ocellatus TaxID=259542 RepID=A0AAV3ZIM4_9GAST|nr:hypothetical protein PoB_002548100 [Plakobranchus ocellatus]